MKIVSRIVGILLLVLGLVWIVYVMGGVFSRAEGFTNLGGLAGALAFHAVTMAVGAFLLGKAAKVKQAAWPFYIWHQTVIVAIGFYVFQWHAGIAVKYLVVSTASLVATILSCELFKLTNVPPVLVWDEAKGS